MAGLERRLLERDYTRIAPATYLLELGSAHGIVGRVALGERLDSHRGYVDVMVHVGVRDPELEELVAECLDERVDPQRPSLTQPLGNLLPRPRLPPVWTFAPGDLESHFESALDTLVDTQATHGERYMRRRSDRESLRAAIVQEGLRDDRIHRVPALMALLGRRRRARLYLRYATLRYARGGGELDDRDRAFARRLAERIG
jgi:hypothetical protein